jgi:hypothetical protein
MKKVKSAGVPVIETDKKLIEAVANELNTNSAPVILSKLQDLEKAIYHLAGKIKNISESQRRLEQISVGMSTTMEQVLHDLDIEDDVADESPEPLKGSEIN